MSPLTVWTLTVDEDSVVTTVHASEAEAVQALRDNYCDGMDVPQSDDEFVDFLIKPTWEGGPGVVFCIEDHDIDVPTVATPASADPVAAISEIRRLAAAANVAVSIVTIPDVLMLKGIDDEPNPEQTAAVVNSYEWRHWGDNWSDWFEGLDLADQ